MKIEIFDPAMCCSTGVCGPSVDPELVRMQENLRQIAKQAPQVKVERYGLSSDPQAFVAHAGIGELLKNEGPHCLPVVFTDGKLVSKGKYPSDAELLALLKQAGHEVVLGEKKKVSSCCGPGCC